MQNEHREELPLGLAMALAADENALRAFCALSDADRQRWVRLSRTIRSKAQMRAFVQALAADTQTPPQV